MKVQGATPADLVLELMRRPLTPKQASMVLAEAGLDGESQLQAVLRYVSEKR